MFLNRGEEVVLVIPDIQAPFQHRDTFDFLRAIKDEVKPTKIVCIGDSMDANALSRWVTDPNGLSQADEYHEALDVLHELYDLFPEGDEVISNHNERIAKRAYGAGIPREFLRSYEEIMHYPEGWHIHPYLEIDGVLYEHGHTQGGMYAARNLAIHNGQSTVIGHHHTTAGILYVSNRNQMLFGMNVGCLIDIDSYAFAYAKETKFKPTLGCGIVYKGVPKFIPMILNQDKRWSGELIL